MNSTLLEAPEHVLSTLERDGTRRWLFPRLTKGYYWRARSFVAYGLIALFVALPHWRINGHPAMLFDAIDRELHFFGFTLLPTDTLLLALFMVSVFLGIFLLTALFGRVWCGWACPQTVYMEYVFRPIERFFDGTMGRGGVPPKSTPTLRRLAKYVVYAILAVGLAHTFLAYFVGIDRLSQWVTQSPFKHPAPFFIMSTTTLLMMFDFCFFREQLCLIACPYGRFQSVLLDRQSLIVAYDHSRGEPRGKVSHQKDDSQPTLGDCVDCGACVRTCPTGIDIRHGLQMECINCTQCIDACDEIMTKLDRPTGLVRYSSQDEIDGKKKALLRPRLIIYPVALTVLLTIFTVVLIGKKSFDATALRDRGAPFVLADGNIVQNPMRLKLVNRTTDPMEVTLKIKPRSSADVRWNTDVIHLEPKQSLTTPILVSAPAESFTNGKIDVDVEMTATDGDSRILPWKILGPLK